MATNTLNTRIALKYDLLSAWNNSNLILNKGEIAIAEIPSQNNIINDTAHTPENTPPAIAMKVGDGVKTFKQLPWVQAVAGDVYAWAKSAVKPTYEAAEISGIKDYIDGVIGNHSEIQDTDTYYKVETGNDKVGNQHVFKLSAYKKNGDRDTAKDITINWSDLDTWMAGEQGRVQGWIEDALSGLTDNTGTGSEGKFVSSVTQKDGQITVTRSKLVAADITDTIADTQVAGLVDLKQDVADLETTLGHVDQAITSTNTLMTKAGVQTAVETYVGALDEQIVTEQGAGNYVTSVERVKGGKIVVTRDTLTHDKIGDWQTEVTDKLALKVNEADLFYSDETKPSETNYIVRKNDIAELAGAMHFEGVVSAIPPSGNYSAGDIVILQGTTKEYVYTGSEWLELGDEGTHASKAALEEVSDRVTTLETNHPADVQRLEQAIAKAETDAVATAQSNTETYVTATLQGLDHTNSGSGKFVTSVTQVDGKVAVVNGEIVLDDLPAIPQSKVTNLETDLAGKQEKFAAIDGTVTTENPVATKNTVVTAVDALDDQLHAIAKSGNVNDLVQTAGDVLIFNCGSATTVI